MKRGPSASRTALAGSAFIISLAALAVLVVVSRHEAGLDIATGSPEPACLDFETIQEAQTFYESEGGPAIDAHGLDADGDGFACEGLTWKDAAADDAVVLAQADRPKRTRRPRATAATGAASTTTTAVGSSSGLPRTGSRAQDFAIVSLGLISTGLLLLTVASARSQIPARRRRTDDYSNIGW